MTNKPFSVLIERGLGANTAKVVEGLRQQCKKMDLKLAVIEGYYRINWSSSAVYEALNGTFMDTNASPVRKPADVVLYIGHSNQEPLWALREDDKSLAEVYAAFSAVITEDDETSLMTMIDQTPEV